MNHPRSIALILLLAMSPVALAASRDSDPYGWRDYTQQLRQEESRRIDRMLDSTYGPNPRSPGVNLQPFANSLANALGSLAESRRQREEQKAANTRFLIELYRQRQQQAAEDARIAAEQAKVAQANRWASDWRDLKEKALAGDAASAVHVARFTRYGSPRLPRGTPTGEKESLPWLQLAANNGSAEAAFDYGILLTPTDPREALRYLTLAAERGFLNAIPHAVALADEGAGTLAPDRTEALRILKIGVGQRHPPSLVSAALLALRDSTATDVSYRQAAAWLAEAGPAPNADGLLAQLLYHGRPGVEVDQARAVALAQRSLAANPKHTGAKEVLGLSLLSETDASAKSRGLQLLREAAEAGSLAAQKQLAFASRNGVGGMAPSDAEARHWLELAARQGDADSALALARMERERPSPDLRAAEAWYSKASRGGSAEAGFEIALLWDQGRHGFPKATIDSHLHARRAAQAGHPEAMELCAWQSLAGRGCPKDPKAAADWMRRAAEAGLASAQHSYALMTLGGTGRDPDPREAFEWESKAAAQGHAKAAAQLAVQLVTGSGCRADAVQAREWAQKSARADDPDGQCLYGLLLLRGDGGPADPAGAVPWLEKAHAQGDLQAALELGQLHRDGAAGFPKDRRRAEARFQEAAKAADPVIAGAAREALRQLPRAPVSLDGLKIKPPRPSP